MLIVIPLPVEERMKKDNDWPLIGVTVE